MFSCNLPPALFGRMTGIFYVALLYPSLLPPPPPPPLVPTPSPREGETDQSGNKVTRSNYCLTYYPARALRLFLASLVSLQSPPTVLQHSQRPQVSVTGRARTVDDSSGGLQLTLGPSSYRSVTRFMVFHVLSSDLSLLYRRLHVSATGGCVVACIDRYGLNSFFY